MRLSDERLQILAYAACFYAVDVWQFSLVVVMLTILPYVPALPLDCQEAEVPQATLVPQRLHPLPCCPEVSRPGLKLHQ